MGKKVDIATKDMVRAILMEELIDKVSFLTRKNKQLESELERLKPTTIEDKKQIDYIN